MSTTFKSFLLAAATAVSVGAVAAPATARTTTASAGTTIVASDRACFSEYWGNIFNNGSTGCAGPRAWLVPAVVDHAGWTNFSVGGIAFNLSSDVSCRAIGTSWDGYVWDLYAAKSLTSVNVFQQINVTSYHTANGSSYLACDITPNGRITTVTY